ncbi:MAG: TolC family protein, partial [Bdellovibrionota bacterium]
MYLLGDEKENQLKLATEEAMAIWKAETGLDIDFDYQGRIESFSGNPEDFPDTDLIISFNNFEDSSFLEYEISKQKKWVDDDLDREILGLNLALVAINSNLNPHIDCESNCLKENGFSSFSLRSALVFEIGRFLGLGPSGLSSSLMFPIQNAGVFKNYSQLRSDDLAFLKALYDLESQDRGRLNGRVIDGVTKEAWIGAHLILLPAESAETFSTTRDQNLFKYSAFSNRDGSFEFFNVKPGNYVLLAESLDGASLSPELFDDFMRVFARRDTFEPDFYDGKDRESNQENLRYSPRAVFFAASLQVFAQEPLSLLDAVQRGLKNNFDAQIQQLEIDQARRLNTWGQAGRLPTVNLNVNQNNSVIERKPANPFAVAGRNISNNAPGQMDIQWTLFNGFAVRLNKERLENLELQTEGNARFILENTVQTIILGYYNVLLE